MLLKGKAMAGIDKYHSYQFTQHGMEAWWCYQIGAQLKPSDPYLSNQEFKLVSTLSHTKMV